MTAAGVILGTAAYMAPEQAKGRTADKRCDVWAIGCVVYEVLAGKRAFEGDDISDTLAAVLRAEPDWSALPADTPQHVLDLLRACLDKDRRTRIPECSTLRFMLRAPYKAPTTPSISVVERPAPSILIWKIVALGVIVTLAESR